MEQFSNGITIVSLYLCPLDSVSGSILEQVIYSITKEASLLYCLPDNPFFLKDGPKAGHGVLEASYAYAGWIFAQHFCNRLGAAYLNLKKTLNEVDPVHAAVLNDVKRRFREETFTRESIETVIHAHSDLVRSKLPH